MIRLANGKDINALTLMLRDMYVELEPKKALRCVSTYLSEIERCMGDDKITTFIDSGYRGFFMVVDETEPMTPSLRRYNGTRVYIRPEYRNGRVLNQFYETIFREFPEGDILGMTVVQSEHIKVLEKRHTRIANLYKLERN